VVAWSVAATFVGCCRSSASESSTRGRPGGASRRSSAIPTSPRCLRFALGIGLAAVLRARRTVGWIAVASGVVGLMLAGATAGLIGPLRGLPGCSW
jgi:hypothetical protein